MADFTKLFVGKNKYNYTMQSFNYSYLLRYIKLQMSFDVLALTLDSLLLEQNRHLRTFMSTFIIYIFGDIAFL